MSQFQPFPVCLPKDQYTENALLQALDDIYSSIDQGLSTLLDSLDLSSAFDTIDHNILINILQTCYGITSIALAWFRSYLSQHSQFVRIGSAKSPITLIVPSTFSKVRDSNRSFSLYTYLHLLRMPQHLASLSSSTTLHSYFQTKPGYRCLGWKSVCSNSKFGSAIMISPSTQIKPTSSYSVPHIQRILLHLFPPQMSLAP